MRAPHPTPWLRGCPWRAEAIAAVFGAVAMSGTLLGCGGGLGSAGEGLLAPARTTNSFPPEILGECPARCVPEEGSGYSCPYTPTYPAWFFPNGTFGWRAPHRDSDTVEIGAGKILGPVFETYKLDGSWEAGWYGGNHLLAPPELKNVTHCACYYASGRGVGLSWSLSNYGIKVVDYSSQFPVETVCPKDFTCPSSNESAFARWGPPWIEAYDGCVPALPPRGVVFYS